jgi:hypothetical protein
MEEYRSCSHRPCSVDDSFASQTVSQASFALAMFDFPMAADVMFTMVLSVFERLTGLPRDPHRTSF